MKIKNINRKSIWNSKITLINNAWMIKHARKHKIMLTISNSLRLFKQIF